MTTETAQIATLAVYYLVLGLLAVYGAHRILMVHLYYRHRRDDPRPAGDLDRSSASHRPASDLQRSLRRRTADRGGGGARLSEAAARDPGARRLDRRNAGRSRERAVARYRELGFDVVHVTRAIARGYKAGALQARARDGERRVPSRSSTRTSCPAPGSCGRSCRHFSDPGVGMVQARWEHLNRDYSLLTRIQSIFLDGHFVIEHTARHRSGRFFNFNGTAGIWRRACLESAGGWQTDTLTEDLDISYRAQLAGWRFVYLKDLVVPAELPVDMNGFKSQQHRWTKGSIQTGKKLLPAILRSRFPCGSSSRPCST